MIGPNEDSGGDIAGLPLEEAVDAVTRDRSIDEDRARTILQPVAEDGTVTWDAAGDRIEAVAAAVETPESRLESAESRLSEIREAADPVSDLAVVTERIDPFVQRLENVDARVADLEKTLAHLVSQLEDREDLFSLAREMETLIDDANRTQRAADELASELRDLETWLTDPETRYDHLDEDLDALETALRQLADSIDRIGLVKNDQAAPLDGAAEDGSTDEQDLGLYWFDARLQQAVFELLIEDVRAEHDAFVEWATRTEEPADRLDALGDRLADLEARCGVLGDRLEELTDEEMHDRFDGRIERFEMTLAAYEPPVDWNAVESALGDHRPDLGAE